MKISKRRDLLKAFALGGGALTIGQTGSTWVSPVVESVMLPAHAQTSGVCSLAAGCYSLEPASYTSWPGGEGPYQNVPGGYTNSNCSGESTGSFSALVIARSVSEAQAAFDAASIPYSAINPTPNQPAELAEGCTVYFLPPPS